MKESIYSIGRNSQRGRSVRMEEYYLMWLTRIDGIGLKRAHRLLEHFGSAEAVWRAEPSAIRRSAILGEKLTEGLLLSQRGRPTDDWIN